MKRAHFFLCLFLTLLLSSCGMRDITGTWEGNGTMRIIGTMDYVYSWTFTEDGQAIAEKMSSKEGSFNETCTYSRTDDTLTLGGNEITYGILYENSGDVLRLKNYDGSWVEFKKVD